jgi:ribosomal protein S12 methylthiotransferase accessory factor
MIDLSDPGQKNLATGMHRTVAAQETVDKILNQKHRFGITRLANVTGLDRVGIPVALAIRPNARSVAVSQGKGMTLEHAKASALMESVEIWHGETFDKPLIYSSFADLSDRHATINVGRLPETAHTVFTDALRILWAEAYELNSAETRLVPFDMIHTDYTDADIPGHGCVPCSTNGLASGNHILEAICHGICEVIERDALSVWDGARERGTPLRCVSADSIDSDDCRTLLTKINDAALDCFIWDMTTDIGIATFTVVIRERGETIGHLGLGSGTHLDRHIAMRRALTEAAQTRLNYISGSRDDLMAAEYVTKGMAEKNAAFEQFVTASSIERSFSDVPTRTHPTLRGDLDDLLAALNAVGIDEVAVVDLTRESVGISVARVIIPGLEAPHDDNAYIPGPRAQEPAI